MTAYQKFCFLENTLDKRWPALPLDLRAAHLRGFIRQVRTA